MTCEKVIVAWDEAQRPAVQWAPALYLAELPALIEILELARPGPTLLIGHSPGLEDLLTYLVAGVGREIAFELRMPTAAIYIVEFSVGETGLVRGSGQIRAHMRPARLTTWSRGRES
jgi:phosphohistidine phosphatase SixA